MEKERKDPKEKKCAICGKDMYAGEDWVFKRKIGGERTKWFCSYKCMRAWDAKHEPKQKRPAGLPEDLDAPAPKEPTSRAVLAKALMKEIQNGGSVIAYLTAEGYKNPYEAYASVRHYCETKMPDALLTLKPLKNLPRGPQKKTGRPRKTAEVVKEDKEGEAGAVPLVLQGGVNYQLKVDEAVQAEEQSEKTYTANEVLRIVDDATLNCQQVTRFRWTSESLEREMFNNSQLNAEGIGMMKLRREIRKKLGADEE